jgi:hypothetical protein
MLRIRKSRPGLYSLFILTLLLAIASLVGRADDEVPARFKPDRYQKVWERNPFTLVTPAAPQVRITPFDKLILVSWLNNGGKDVVFVQNSDTSEVQKVTKNPNPNYLRSVEIHKSADPKMADVVLSNGVEQGSVKFRLEMPTGVPQVEGGQQPPGTATGAQSKVRDPARARNIAPNANAAECAAASFATGSAGATGSRPDATGNRTDAAGRRTDASAGLRSPPEANYPTAFK